jgi:subtilisin family serine protease
VRRAGLLTVALAAPLIALAGTGDPVPGPASSPAARARGEGPAAHSAPPVQPQGQPVPDDALAPFAKARGRFHVDGKGLAIAVLDSGLDVENVDFAGPGRIPARVNFTFEDGNRENVKDDVGHGTSVAGIVLAHGRHVGVAPGANVVPIKILDRDGGVGFEGVQNGLAWVLENHARFGITTVLLGIADGGNYADDDRLGEQFQGIRRQIADLRQRRVATVASAGNAWYQFNNLKSPSVKQGMCFPAICRETISVGAVFGAPQEREITFGDGLFVSRAREGQIIPFSQRLHEREGGNCQTDVFAPGTGIVSIGVNGPAGQVFDSGTDISAAVVAGSVLLMQQHFKQNTDELPTVDDLEKWLRDGSQAVVDTDEKSDNTRHTGLAFRRLDIAKSLGIMPQPLARPVR